MQAAVTPETLAAAVAAADVGVLICDRALPDMPLVFVNDAFCAMTGYAREEVLGRNCRFLQGPGTDRAVATGLGVAIAAGRPAEAELLNYRKDGSSFYNALRITPLAGGSAPARYLIGVTQDVTDRVEAARTLRQREALLAQTGRIARVGGWQLDLATMTTEWSDEVYRIHELAPGDRHGLDRALDYYPPEARAVLEPTLARAIATGEPFDLELPFVTALGNRRWVRAMGEGEREAGRVVRLIGIFQDITERKRAELVLRESEERFRNMADHAPTVVWVTDAVGRPLYVSRRWYELTGQSPDAEHDWLSAVHPDDRPALLQDAELAWAERRPFRFEYRLCGPDGNCRWVVDAGAPRYAEDGVFLGYVGSVLDIEERRQAEERARELSARLNALSTAGIVGITVIEGERIVEANDAFLHMLGYAREDLAAGGLEWQRLTAPEALDRNLVAIEEMIAAGFFRQFEKEYLHKDGSRVPVLLSAVVLDRGQRRWMCLIEDMGERKRVEAALRESEAKLRATQEHAGVGISEVDAEGRFLNVNPALCALVGYPREELIGRCVFDITCADEVEIDRESFRRVVAGEDQAYTMQKRYLCRDGSERWTEVTASAVRDAAGRFLYGVRMVQDIHDRRLAEAQVRHLAHHDPLTGLPNRTLLQDRLQQALLQARRHGEQVGLLLLDLDRFKDVNDTLGHDVGDALLREIAVRLKACVRDTDTVARLGGDEFAVVLPRLRTAATAAEIAGKILAALAEPVTHADGFVHTGTSIGITLYPADGEEVAQLLKNADIALYKAKAEHGGDYCFFEPRLRRQVERRQGLEHELRLALARGEIVPHFQPKVRLEDGQVVGFEALARWHHAERGLVLPGEFLRVAEDTGLITRLGETMLRQAMTALRAWSDRRLAPGYVAVNVAGAQLRRRGFATLVGEILAEAGLPPTRLVVEVTEGVFLGRRTDGVATELEALHALGVTVALDDFGTGYASLSHLRRFPVGVLKIDQSFVRDMLADPGDAAIVRAVINLGHSFGMGVTAEGVETAEQADWLRLQGCDLGQGYLYGRPMPAEAVPAWLRARRAQPHLADSLPG